MEVPVAQAGPPNAQSAPCTPPKSSQKIQDNDEEESNEESVEFDDEDVVSPSGKPRHWKLLGEWDTTAPPPDAQSQTVTVLGKKNDNKCLRLLFDAEEVGESKEVSCGHCALQQSHLEFETEQKILMQ
jgi:hypothetical protein